MEINLIKYLLLLPIFAVIILAKHPKIITVPSDTQYEPTWDSLDTRPIPSWFDEAKVGIFLHWGVFSVPSFGGEWFWSDWAGDNITGDFSTFMRKNYRPNFTYQNFAPEFKAEFYNPDDWADLFQRSGAKYVVLTSKHHEGFTMWPSKYSFGWNVNDVGPNRDLLGDLATAVRAKNLTFGLYHSLYEWFNPIYLSDKDNNFTTQEFVDNKMLPEMYELINAYQPSILWSDGDWEANDTYFRSTEFLAWLYNESPVKDTVVVNDRWGIGIPCAHGDFYTCTDRFNPGVLQPHKWENAMTVDKYSWGYRREANITDYLTTHELLQTLTETISCGGNILINVGPTKEGTILPIFQERLLEVGEWLSINGEAIYKSKPWTVQNDTLTSGVWFTTNDDNAVYAIVLNWPNQNVLSLRSPVSLFNENSETQVVLLGNDGALTWEVKSNIIGNFVNIKFPDKATVASKWAWVLKISSS